MLFRFLLSLFLLAPFTVFSQTTLRHAFTATDFAGLAGTTGANNHVEEAFLGDMPFSLTLSRTQSLSAEPFTVSDIEGGCLVGEDNAGIGELYIKSARLAKALILSVSLEFGLRNSTSYTDKSSLTVRIIANGIENQSFKQKITTGETYIATFAPGASNGSQTAFDYTTPLTIRINNASCDNLVLKSLEISYYDLTADIPRHSVAYGTTLDIRGRYDDADDCWYTLDGTLPTHDNHLSNGQVTVTEALTVRTMTFPPASTKISKQCADTINIIPVNNVTQLRRVAFNISENEWPVNGEYPSTHSFEIAAVETSRADDDDEASDDRFTLTLARERPNTSGTAMGSEGYQLLWNAGDTGVFSSSNPDNVIEAVHLNFQTGSRQMSNLGEAEVKGATLVNREGESVLTTAPQGGGTITVTPESTADGDYARLNSASVYYTKKSETTSLPSAVSPVPSFSAGYYTLEGVRLIGEPTRPGLYIKVSPGLSVTKIAIR